ncbi:hypothetical protein QS257_15045 [Terrilactibacillus sp. S3-3]|nr:hypothetical protein QS257_15045 [Terrilactibacillus sp. S3-3]
MKKLFVQYGSYFMFRYLITFKHDDSDRSKCRCKGLRKWRRNGISIPD